MGKRSSESDSSDYHSKKRSGRSRYRHSSSDSSGSSYHRRHKKSKSKHKSKSRKHSRSREHRKRSGSPSRSIRSRDSSKTRSYSRVTERRRSCDPRSRSRRSHSRDSKYSHNRRSDSRERKQKNVKVLDLSSGNEESQHKMSNADLDIEAKLKEKFSATTTDFDIEDVTTVSTDLNDPDKFLQFSSSSKKVPDNIVIDLKSQTILVPKVDVPEEKLTIFHPNLIPSEELRIEKWIKDLYSFRQKALRGEIKP